MSLSYSDAVRFLSARTAGKKKWSLGPTRLLLEKLGNPEHHFRSVHIGGTNGKGSVASMVYSALRTAGFDAALYTSPHLVDVRERILVNGNPISRDSFKEWTTRLQSSIQSCDASFFEATTAIAFADFAARGADLAVIEVGLGGRLDATNVVSPLVSVVTNVSLEHTDYLGESIEDIAREKAGIAKRDTPFVIGDGNARTERILRESAEKRGALVSALAPDVHFDGQLTLEGDFQRRNGAIAEAVLRRLPSALRPCESQIRAGIGSTFVPGRFDRRGQWLFDVAHNDAGVTALVDQMGRSNLPRPIHALVSIVDDKDWKLALPKLRAATDSMWLTVTPSMPAGRRPDPQLMATCTGIDAHIEPDFARAVAEFQSGAGTALVTGSCYTVGDVLSRLPGFAPLG